jgi:NAD(P)-dependent dehydrogenase (short-subunit alcohol dehydrogenase family)
MKTVLIVGAGGVLGSAIANEFSEAGYAVVGVRRDRAPDSTPDSSPAPAHNQARLSKTYCIDFLNPQELQQVIDQVIEAHGGVDVLIYNAAQLVIAPFMETTINDFENTWRASALGAAISAQAVLPSMLKRQQGCLIFSGATAALRGTHKFAAFASAKFALRGLTQSLAREFQSQGIHIAHVVIDGLLKGSASVQRFNGREENSIDPIDVARNYRWLAEQSRSAWTLELDLRPSSERF